MTVKFLANTTLSQIVFVKLITFEKILLHHFYYVKGTVPDSWQRVVIHLEGGWQSQLAYYIAIHRVSDLDWFLSRTKQQKMSILFGTQNVRSLCAMFGSMRISEFCKICNFDSKKKKKKSSWTIIRNQGYRDLLHHQGQCSEWPYITNIYQSVWCLILLVHNATGGQIKLCSYPYNQRPITMTLNLKFLFVH
jgi:hypothetical protein